MVKLSEFKLVFLGTSGVGKTSLIHQFMDGNFNESSTSTVELGIRTKIIRVGNNTSIKLQIWDTAGQERYFGLVSMFYRDCHAAVVVYDIENLNSFNRAQSWVRSLENLNSPPKVIALAANKTEATKNSVVDIEMVQQYAEEHNLTFMETSSKTSLNVNEIFQAVAEKLSYEYGCYAHQDDKNKIRLNNHRNRNTGKRCC